jgi:hypothetical protein
VTESSPARARRCGKSWSGAGSVVVLARCPGCTRVVQDGTGATATEWLTRRDRLPHRVRLVEIRCFGVPGGGAEGVLTVGGELSFGRHGSSGAFRRGRSEDQYPRVGRMARQMTWPGRDGVAAGQAGVPSQRMRAAILPRTVSGATASPAGCQSRAQSRSPQVTCRKAGARSVPAHLHMTVVRPNSEALRVSRTGMVCRYLDPN